MCNISIGALTPDNVQIISLLAPYRYLSPYYGQQKVETPQLASMGYETVPTVTSMVDVFISEQGFVSNEKVSCAQA